MTVYEFGPFQLDAERLLLLDRSVPVSLGPKVVETLLSLIEHPGDVLTKSALLDRIWPEGYVDEANFAQNVYVLRKTLRAPLERRSDRDDSAPRIPVVRAECSDARPCTLAEPSSHRPRCRRRPPSRLAVAAVALLALVLIADGIRSGERASHRRRAANRRAARGFTDRSLLLEHA